MARFDIRKIKKINLRLFRQLPAHQKRMTWSNRLTLLRIVLAPIIVVAMIGSYWGVAVSLFVVAAVTDCLDGTLARMRNEKTFLGACLDPIADKVLLLSCFFTLAFFQSPLFMIPHWFVWSVLCKELLLVGGSIFLYVRKGYLDICPTLLGKLTTLMQMGFIIWLFACYFFQWVPIKTYYTMLGALLILVGASFVHYASIGIRFLRS